MKHWLLKSEPSVFGIDDLAKSARRTTGWEGVRNYQARNFIRDEMKRGDLGFFYHSSCEVPGIVGIVEVTREAYPDPTAWDRRSPYYDAKSPENKPLWYAVDVQLKRRLRRPITLEELRRHADGALKDFWLLRRGNRLSVLPVSDAHWEFILGLE